MHEDAAVTARSTGGESPLECEGVVFKITAIRADVAAKLVGAIALADEDAARGNAPDVSELHARDRDGGGPAREIAAVKKNKFVGVERTAIEDDPQHRCEKEADLHCVFALDLKRGSLKRRGGAGREAFCDSVGLVTY